ncbi:MAG: glycosyltransferase [Vulcanimicrobiaceae bacterium]|jgi:GT2 family glycosyltransferase
MTIDVVIPQYGNWELTEQCLNALPRDPSFAGVFVVDDGSPDDAAARLRERRDVTAILLSHNGGFAAACNAGAAAGHAEAILFLNNDTLVQPGASARLVAILEADPTVGAVVPKLVYVDGTIQSAGTLLRNPTAPVLLYRHLDAETPEANVARDDLVFTGAALLVRRSLFEAVGGFDAGYRNGYEDLDLALRIWTQGFRCRYEPAATVVHLEGASRGKRPHDEANAERFAARWSPFLDLFPLPAWSDPPALALRWDARTGLARLARDCFAATWREFGGARFALVRSPVERALLHLLAHLDRRRALDVTAETDGRADVRLLSSVPDYLPDLESRYWVCSDAARDTVVARGVPRDRVSTFRFGVHGTPRASEPRLREAVVLIARCAESESQATQAIARALGDLPWRAIALDDPLTPPLDALRRADLVVVAADDPWGILVTEALANGALVVARRDTPSLEIVPSATYVALAEDQTFADAVAEVRARFEAYAPRAARAVREVARRLPLHYGGRRLRALAVLAAHGTPPADAVAVTPARAAALREVVTR